MKKLNLSVILLIFSFLTLSAQKQKDVLYLKNGSTIYGKLMEVSENQYKIKTSDGSFFVFSSSEVEKFVNESPKFEGRKKSGAGVAMEGGFLIGAQSADYKAAFSFNILGNVTTNTRNIFGIGTGVEYLGNTFTPLFFEYKYIFSEKRVTPFMFFRAGRLFHLNGDNNSDSFSSQQTSYQKDYSGGGTFTIGTGVSWANEDGETYLSFAYRNAHTSYSQENYAKLTETYRNAYNRLEVKFGFKF
jgi:hypothetical protein